MMRLLEKKREKEEEEEGKDVLMAYTAVCAYYARLLTKSS